MRRASRAAASSPDRLEPTTRTRSPSAAANRRTRADESGAIAGHVGKDERDEPRRRRPSQAPALDRRELRPETIERVDRSTRSSELPDQHVVSAPASRPRAAAARREDAPPERRQRIVSSRPKLRKNRSARRAARRLDASGSGCAANATARRGRPRAECPRGRTTSAGAREPSIGQRRARHPGGRLSGREEADAAAPTPGPASRSADASARATAASGSAPARAARWSASRRRRARMSFTGKQIKASPAV